MNNPAQNKIINIILLFLFLVAGTAFQASAQEHLGKGRISGKVTDEQGNPIEGALITVESLKYDTKLEGRSDENGNFAVAGMGSGLWRITASKEGYSSSYVQMNISQLKRNPPITFTLKKIEGIAALIQNKDAYTMFDEGNILIQQGKYEEALELFNDFLEQYPKIYHVHLNIGSCYLNMGELDKAETEFQLVLDKVMENHGDYKQDPQTSLRAFTGMGEVYVRKGDFNKAQEYFSKALDISPEDEIAAYNVGEVYFSHQKIDDAIRYFNMAVKIKPDWPKPQKKLGYVYLNKGDFQKALEHFKKFIEMAPDDPEVPQIKNIIATLENMKK